MELGTLALRQRAVRNERFVLHKSDFDEIPYFSPSWGASKGVYMQHRTIGTWFRHQTEAGFLVRNFLNLSPSPRPTPLMTQRATTPPPKRTTFR